MWKNVYFTPSKNKHFYSTLFLLNYSVNKVQFLNSQKERNIPREQHIRLLTEFKSISFYNKTALADILPWELWSDLLCRPSSAPKLSNVWLLAHASFGDFFKEDLKEALIGDFDLVGDLLCKEQTFTMFTGIAD